MRSSRGLLCVVCVHVYGCVYMQTWIWILLSYPNTTSILHLLSEPDASLMHSILCFAFLVWPSWPFYVVNILFICLVMSMIPIWTPQVKWGLLQIGSPPSNTDTHWLFIAMSFRWVIECVCQIIICICVHLCVLVHWLYETTEKTSGRLEGWFTPACHSLGMTGEG